MLAASGFTGGPILGAAIAQKFSYEAMFALVIAALALCWLILALFFTDPRRLHPRPTPL